MRPDFWWSLVLASLFSTAACALDRPWISDVYFYWYTWDYERELGGWLGGVYHTPLVGYYDSRRYDDNYRELWLASEWGLTHHFMDYWSPNWKDAEGKPRDVMLMRVAEQLRQEGYDIWMSYYQDGTDFEMKNFVENMNSGRDVHLGLRKCASSPVWPQWRGKPFHLVYGRNGRPELTDDQDGFRAWLRKKYRTLAALNEAWGTSFAAWNQVELDFSRGLRRADAIRYQYHVWERDWAQLEEAVQREFGFPGLRVSFDVAYQPFRGFGYSNFARVFGGPHSYGGIFDQPQAQDVERFIQSIVAKYYDTVFFDHFKNFYYDWEIRTPGTCYPPEPYHFDRFWVGDLMRYAEAVLHLSWNEWWEGSNLEPCLEYGKTYCEKNLFYATLMKLAFPSLHDYAKGAQVAVLLNDWQWLVGSRQQSDLYETIQTLRTLTVPFDLIPDDFVTQEKLANFKLVIAPAAGVGFGENARGEPVAEVLQRWLQTGSGRHLLVSACEEFTRFLDLQEMPSPVGVEEPGPDMNLFVDIGTPGDDTFLVEGASGRENWGQLPPDAFGATTRDLTMRWTPASGTLTTFLLPASPHRDHVLRFSGSALRENVVHILVNGTDTGTVALRPNLNQYEHFIPAAAIGGRRLVEVRFQYERAIVPQKVDPARFPTETRVCNLAFDWLQFATAGTPLSREQNYTLPQQRVRLRSPLFGPFAGREVEVPYLRHARLTHPEAEILSEYTADGAPRDLLFRRGKNEVIYVNGLLSGLGEFYLEGLVTRWAEVTPPHRLQAPKVRGTVLEAENTQLVLAYNYDFTQPQTVRCTISTDGKPVAEVMALATDGQQYLPLLYQLHQGHVAFSVPLRYYGVYAVVRSPVRVSTPPLVLHPGEMATIPLTVENLTDRPVRGAVRLHAVIPTLGSNLVSFALGPREIRQYPLSLKAKPTVDWGHKTVALKVNAEGEIAYFLRELVVERNPDLQIATPAVSSRQPQLALTNAENGFIGNAAARKVKVTIGEQTLDFGTIASGQTVSRPVPLLPAYGESWGGVREQPITITYDLWGETVAQQATLRLVYFPPLTNNPPSGYGSGEATARLLVANPFDEYLENGLAVVDLKGQIPAGVDTRRLFVREAGGNAVPWQMDGRRLTCLVMLPPRTVTALWLGAGEVPSPPTDLQVETQDLGTGHGTVTLRNSRLSLTLDEARGGTVTSFISAASGLDYATGSFGVNYGKFSEYDPTKPRTNTARFVREEKFHQRDRPGRIRVVEKGPVRVRVEVEWQDDNLRVRQTYTLSAYQDYFTLTSAVEPLRPLEVQELVLVDARFRRNNLTKIFPNFTGIPRAFGEEKTHFGWRQAGYVPPYATLMTPDHFPESISFILQRSEGVNLFRQGFWPPQRPQPGPCTYAQVEYISTTGKAAYLTLAVKVHAGHQVVAKRFRPAEVRSPLLALDWLPSRPSPAVPSPPVHRPSPLVPRPSSLSWWHSYWHYRAPLRVAGPVKSGQTLTAPVNFTSLLPAGEVFDEGSVRVV
ncbi:MAG TPA: hypothetical protein EYP85_14730, partial [Armatimonadetes bacterium]|nr:hypothetical protein [Armatimonadota bacterium]